MLHHGLIADVERVSSTLPNYLVVNPFGDKDDLDDFIKLVETQAASSSFREGTDEGGITDSDIRECGIDFINYDYTQAGNTELFDKVFHITNFYNQTAFQFDITGFSFVQYTFYDKTGSHYDWHVDKFDDVRDNSQLHRKLSFAMILSDKDEYEGANFEINAAGMNHVLDDVEKGDIIIFPSYTPHRVAPLISGVRKSLVWWALGPKFR